MRERLKPSTVAAFDRYAATLPDPVATVANLPITVSMTRAEMMRIMPWGLPSDDEGRRLLLQRAIGFLADGLRVQHAVEAASLVTEVHDRLDGLLAQKRGAHPTMAAFEAAIAKHWMSPASHRLRWYRIVGLRALARSKGAARVGERELRERYERNPSALTTLSGEPLSFQEAAPFLKDIVAQRRVREEARREFHQLQQHLPVRIHLPNAVTAN